MTTIELRLLGLGDLRAIEEIERRSYPTPWSRSMFAGELAKPSSIWVRPESSTAVRFDPITWRWLTRLVTFAPVPRRAEIRWETVTGLVPSV